MSREVGYGITDTWDEIVEAMQEIAPTTLEGVNQRVTELATIVRHDTNEDRPYHRRTAMLLDRELTYANRAWTGSEDMSAAIEAHTLEARDPECQDELAEAGSSCTKGVIGLTQWLEKMKFIFHISNCIVACQVKFATCILQGNALTWWKSHVRIFGHDVSDAMPWKTLKKMITDKYCLRELALMCDRMFHEESDKVEKYVGGLLEMIHRNVKASKPKTMQEAIEFATELMDQKILSLAERKAEKKRKFNDILRNNQNQQQPFKSKNVAQAYTAWPREKKPYEGSKPMFSKCSYHHDGQCGSLYVNGSF
nr:hypothetical protein [Tanacetum cinerariifolium]